LIFDVFTVDRSQYFLRKRTLQGINISEAPRRKADQTSLLMIAGIVARVKSSSSRDLMESRKRQSHPRKKYQHRRAAIIIIVIKSPHYFAPLHSCGS
jgi:hypothetical protein